MFRLAHISDLHLGPIPDISWGQLCSKRITGYLNWKLNRKGSMKSGTLDVLIEHLKGADPDHIAITGDLVNLALPVEFMRARKWLEDLSAPEMASVVLGNHDAYIRGALDTAVQSWKPYLLGDNGSQTPVFPYRRDRQNTAIIGVNSAEPTLPFFATGYFRKDQAERLAKMLDEAKQDGKFRIAMIHHPPFKNGTAWSKRLIGDDLFRETIKQHGAELVLHGHNHLNSLNWIDGPDGTIVVVGVPAAGKSAPPAGATSHGHPGGRYNLFEITGHRNNWACTLKEFGFADGESAVSLIETHDCMSPRF